MFKVFQDGKAADSIGFPEIQGWDNSEFQSFEEAEEYANLWAYPVTKDWLKLHGINPMQLSVAKDMSIGEIPVMMEIKEVKS